MLEHKEEHPSRWSAIQSVASKIGCSSEFLRNWVRRAERDAGRLPGLTTDERRRLKDLEREVVELHRRGPMRDAALSRGSAVVLAVALSVFQHSCRPATPHCEVYDGVTRLFTDAIVDQVTREQALERVLDRTAELNPPELQDEIAEGGLEGTWRAVTAGIPTSAEVWWFHEEKGLVGRREGLVVIDGCRVLKFEALIEDL